ncbi:proline-rich extensin-like protein EPR1 isoform X2 [Maniola jurtina]|uniref:proline-rich extensin-like protein EPR1 isoform X2 n=1 Tax=Maniola jurtina TaxID=191418 RepID=UPI001E68E3D2|nr:proline-rich extensin-like protein EPR1 isoform X2 [Maniola jurtina]
MSFCVFVIFLAMSSVLAEISVDRNAPRRSRRGFNETRRPHWAGDDDRFHDSDFLNAIRYSAGHENGRFTVTSETPTQSTLVPPITKNENGWSTETSETPPQSTPVPPVTNDWIYIGIGIGLAVLLVVSQSICFCLYIRKLKSSQLPRNIPLITPDENCEDRYQRAPSKSCVNTLRPSEKNHSSSLYEYECVKHIDKGKKPEPPPTSTLPKRNRPPLPLPNNIQEPKSSTLTPHSTQELLQQRGRQVSTVPSKPPINFNAHAPMPSRSPQPRRLPTPVRTPVLKPRDTTRDERSYKIYESLPDLREFRHQAKPSAVHPPIVFTPSSTITTPNLNRMRMLPGHRSNLSRDTPSPVMPPKPRMPLPQEYNRNGYPTKLKENMITTNGSSFSIYESLPDLREFKHHQKPPLAPPPVFTPVHHSSSNLNIAKRVPGPDSISNELMEKLKRRANLTSQSTSQITRSPTFPRKPPVMPPPKVTPIAKYVDESSDDEEWTIEEIKQINMYNV